MNLNEIKLIGRLVRDPELRYIPDGTAVCEFTIAVNRRFKKDKTDFFKCIAWRKLGETCSQYLFKGSAVYVSGEFQKEKYTNKEGIEKDKSQVVVNDIQFLTPKPKNNDMYQSNENEVPF